MDSSTILLTVQAILMHCVWEGAHACLLNQVVDSQGQVTRLEFNTEEEFRKDGDYKKISIFKLVVKKQKQKCYL